MENKLNWLVTYIASRQEKNVSKLLAEINVEHYLPISKKLRQWSDRKKWVEFPMFNGYMFVKPTALQLDKVLETQGVICYLKFEREHAIVRDSEIEIIKAIEKSGYFVEAVNTPENFEIGETAKVIGGPLKGKTVDLIRKNNEQIFLVSFETLGQSIKINIPAELLAKV